MEKAREREGEGERKREREGEIAEQKNTLCRDVVTLECIREILNDKVLFKVERILGLCNQS